LDQLQSLTPQKLLKLRLNTPLLMLRPLLEVDVRSEV
jgi:hypothetical protein